MWAVNTAGIATGAFFGVLALIAAISCIPPITRFLGDLFCCPWRIPFTKKKRRNADEEVGSDELPYVVEPRAGTPVDNVGYRNMSEAYMSALSVVDPEIAKEEMRRSIERRSTEYRRHHSGSPGSSHGNPFQHPNDSYHSSHPHSSSPTSLASNSTTDYYRQHQQHHHGSQLNVPTPPPHGGHWSGSSSRGASRQQLHHQHSSDSYVSGHGYEAEVAYHATDDAFSPPVPEHRYHGEHIQAGQYVQRPLPSHPHPSPELVASAGYFPNTAYDQHDYERHPPSTEQLVSGRRGHYPNA